VAVWQGPERRTAGRPFKLQPAGALSPTPSILCGLGHHPDDERAAFSFRLSLSGALIDQVAIRDIRQCPFVGEGRSDRRAVKLTRLTFLEVGRTGYCFGIARLLSTLSDRSVIGARRITNKRFEQTGDIKTFEVLAPGYDAPFRLIVDDAGRAYRWRN
jgi:hypothetical protein